MSPEENKALVGKKVTGDERQVTSKEDETELVPPMITIARGAADPPYS